MGHKTGQMKKPTHRKTAGTAHSPAHAKPQAQINENAVCPECPRYGQRHPLVNFLAKTWDFLWNDDSFASWLANVIVAFMLIKFVVYPLLAITFGAQYPIVAVVSGSMEHGESFDKWWSSQANCGERTICTQGAFYESIGITKEDFRDFSFKNGFNTGDIMMLFGTEPENINIGDIIVFKSGGEPIIHRVIKKSRSTDGKYVFETKGDHNRYQIITPQLDETGVKESSIVGRAIIRVPCLGYIKIWFFDALNYIFNLGVKTR